MIAQLASPASVAKSAGDCDRLMMMLSDSGDAMRFVRTPFSKRRIMALSRTQEPTLVGKEDDPKVVYEDRYLTVEAGVRRLRCVRCHVNIIGASSSAKRKKLVLYARDSLIEGTDVDVVFSGAGRNVYIFEGARVTHKGRSAAANVGRLGVSPSGRTSSIVRKPSPVCRTKRERRSGSMSPTRVARLFQ